MPNLSGKGFDASVRRRPQQDVINDFWTIAVLGHQRQRRGHVTADRIADHSDTVRISAELRGMLGGPFKRRVSLVNLNRAFDFRQRGVLKGDCQLLRLYNDIAQKKLVLSKLPTIQILP